MRGVWAVHLSKGVDEARSRPHQMGISSLLDVTRAGRASDRALSATVGHSPRTNLVCEYISCILRRASNFNCAAAMSSGTAEELEHLKHLDTPEGRKAVRADLASHFVRGETQTTGDLGWMFEGKYLCGMIFSLRGLVNVPGRAATSPPCEVGERSPSRRGAPAGSTAPWGLGIARGSLRGVRSRGCASPHRYPPHIPNRVHAPSSHA